MIPVVIPDPDGTLIETGEMKGIPRACAVTELNPTISEDTANPAYSDFVGHTRQEAWRSPGTRCGASDWRTTSAGGWISWGGKRSRAGHSCGYGASSTRAYYLDDAFGVIVTIDDAERGRHVPEIASARWPGSLGRGLGSGRAAGNL